MKRHRLSILAGISTLLAIAIIAMWVRSYHHVSRFGFSTLRARWTFVSRDGSIALMTPPSAPWTADEAKAWDCVKRLRNEDIEWMALWDYDGDVRHTGLWELFASPKVGSAAFELTTLGNASSRPLLRALDGQKKFAAAHILLAMRYNASAVHVMGPPGALDGSGEVNVLMNCAGLKVRFHRASLAAQSGAAKSLVVDERSPGGDAEVPPGQLEGIRNIWHSYLDVRLAAVPDGVLFILALVLPAIWIRESFRRRQNTRLGLCRMCGYDLRASTGCCPECGTKCLASNLTESTS